MRRELGKIRDCGIFSLGDKYMTLLLTLTGPNFGALDTSIVIAGEEDIAVVAKLIRDAKALTIVGLKDKPVYVDIENNTLKGWGILTEVL